MLTWPVLIGIVSVVSITAVYFIWLRKPAAIKQEEHPQQQPQA